MRVSVIKNHDGDPYLVRLTIFDLGFITLRLHVILRSDDDRALHDHPWSFWTFILCGGYWEHQPANDPDEPFTVSMRVWRSPLSLLYRPTTHLHRIELKNDKPAVTLVVTGRKIRDWGFACHDGWRNWRLFDARGCE